MNITGGLQRLSGEEPEGIGQGAMKGGRLGGSEVDLKVYRRTGDSGVLLKMIFRRWSVAKTL